MVQETYLQATPGIVGPGRLHLAYSRGGNGERTVEYAHSANEGGDSWTIETVRGEGRAPACCWGA